MFRVHVSGVPQLWRVDVSGAVTSLAMVDSGGGGLAEGDVAADGGSAVLSDLYLIPSDHWFRVSGDGDYAIHLTPLGPPGPDAEHEPNNDANHAEPMLVGQRKVGRLASRHDSDMFRLSVAATEHVAFHVDPPVDGAVALSVWEGGYGVLSGIDAPVIGRSVSYDVVLQPGDYDLRLTTLDPSEDPYSFAIERLDPFTIAADQEPNDIPTQAQPLPASLVVRGSGRGTRLDDDWYRLEPSSAGAPLTIQAEGSVQLRLSDGVTDIPLTPTADGTGQASGPLPTGVPLYLDVQSSDDYTVTVSGDGLTATAAPRELPTTLDLKASQADVAAYWTDGQTLGASLSIVNTGTADVQLSLDSLSSHHAWVAVPERTEVSVPAGSTTAVPVTIRVPPDAWADIPVRLTVRARDTIGAQATAFVEVTPRRDTAPVAPYRAWSVPNALLGGLDVAALALGGAVVPSIDPIAEAQLHDGLTTTSSGFATAFSGQPITLTSDLAGDTPVPVAGTIIDPLAAGGRLVLTAPRHFELLLSTDGVTYTSALTGDLSTVPVDQSFVLPAPVLARFAQLRIDSTYAGPGSQVALGEWKVIATPGWVPSSDPIDVADDSLGGHIVWATPQFPAQVDAEQMLTEDPTPRVQFFPSPSIRPTWVIGFQDDRAARLQQLQWVDPSGSDPAIRSTKVDIAVSVTSPLGPWQEIGTWSLARKAHGSVAPFTFDGPTWARFIRLTANATKKDAVGWEPPGMLRALEVPASDLYRSVVGEWGQDSPFGPYEWQAPPPAPLTVDAGEPNDTPETATPLAAASVAVGRVHRGEDVDHYAVAIPAGQNSLTFTVHGSPTVGVRLTLLAADGSEVPMSLGLGEQPGAVEYAANVEPGSRYDVEVEQPAFSAALSFDTSGSLVNYYPFIAQALRAYSADVVAGEESVMLIPFEEQPLLKDWSDQAYLLQDAVNRYAVGYGSSSAETALIEDSKALAGRDGARAILLVTDAITSSYQRNQEMWQALAQVRPLVFAVQVGNDDAPSESLHFMQDWAIANGGHYQYVVSHGDMDRAFDRMATWLRRPAAYTLSYQTSTKQLPPPRPGTISVVSASTADGSTGGQPRTSNGVAVELILDTSGSMLDRFGGKRRIDIAKSVLDKLVNEDLPAGAPVALRVFTQKSRSCDTQLAVPLGPLDPTEMTATIDGLTIQRSVNTPLAAAIKQVATDLAGVTGPRIVVVVSDGLENCGGNPAKAVKQLRAKGVDITLNVVGLALSDKKIRKSIGQLAKLGGGTYFDARDPSSLEAGIRAAVSPPFEVYDASGALVGSGTVNGSSVSLPPGTYRVVVLSDPQQTFDGVVVPEGGAINLTLGTSP